MSRDEDMGLISEESDESGLELGLTLGGGGVGRSKRSFFTAKDLPSSVMGSPSSLSSSSSSSTPYLTKAADFPVSPPANTAASNQVVGWPPIRAYRMNSLTNQVKYPSSDEFQPTVEKCKNKNDDVDMSSCEGDKKYVIKEEGGHIKKSNFVKVNKDGNGIGRKVDLSAHSCYETLAQAMEDMFSGAGAARRSSVKEHDLMIEARGSIKLLDGSSEFVLTYEDKDGDWMLVGDVPWGMFINSVKRLRIMRTAEANGLGCKFQVTNVRQSLPI